MTTETPERPAEALTHSLTVELSQDAWMDLQHAAMLAGLTPEEFARRAVVGRARQVVQALARGGLTHQEFLE